MLGVSREQANAFCAWRTSTTNKVLAKQAGDRYALDEEGVFFMESSLSIADYGLLTKDE